MKTNITFSKILAGVFTLLVFLSPAIAQAQCSCPGNIVQNPGFENSSNNWTESGGHFHIESGSETVCGTKYGRFHISNASSRAWQQLNSTSLGAGASLAVTFYAAVNDASHTHEAGVYYWDASWNLISKQVANINKEMNASPAGLQLYSFNSVQPVGVTHVTLEMRGTDGSIYSDAWCVTVTPGCPNNVTSGGTIGNDESYCTTNFDPANIVSLSSPSGGTGTLEYIWMQSTNGGSSSTVIPGANGATYDPPAISQTTWYRRGARRAGCSTYNLGLSNWVKKEIACITTDSVCFVGTSNPHVNAKIVYITNTSLNTVTVRTIFSKNFVDNTYGNTAIGWPGGHTLGELRGSDHLILDLFDANNTKQMELKLDYIHENNGSYYCGGVTQGEGSVNQGNPAHVLGATSSLHQNFNQLGYSSYLTNSPATDTNYTPNPAAPNWIYDVWYEVTVDMAAFGTPGFGYPRVSSVHASPSKTGSNTEVVVPGPCPTLMVSGTVFYDFDALDNNKVDGYPIGKPSNTTLYVNLVNDSSGKVTKTTTVNNNGTYSFSNMTANTNYTLVLSTTQGTIGNNPPSAMLPTNWINTGESPNIPTHDGTVDGNLSISLGYANMPNLNYGIQNSQAIVDSQCLASTSNPNVTAKLKWTITGPSVTIRATYAKKFVDNTYGNTAIGWPGGHTLGNLEGSDKITLNLYDANNTKKMELVVDYIEKDNNLYYSGGVTSGEGKVNQGNAAHVLGATTSLHQNFNQLGYSSYTTNSPATDTNYTPNPAAPNWIYDVWYEVTIDMAAFGTAGFGYPQIASVHASPSKTGNNTEIVIPGPCPTVNLSGNVYNDINGLTDNTVNGTPINDPSTIQLYANLINTANNVAKVTPININGKYTFMDVPINTNFTVVLSTTQGTVGNTAPAPLLPNGWKNTGEDCCDNVGSDGLVDGKVSVAIGTVSQTNANFGIQQPPTPGIDSLPDTPNPGDSICVVVPGTKFKGIDASVGGIITELNICTFPTGIDRIDINGVSYYATNFPSTGVTIPTNAQGEPTQNICIDPKNGLQNVLIKYTVTDNAGAKSACDGEVRIKFYPLSISGMVFNDESGPANVDGSPIGQASGVQLYANLVSTSNTVIAVQPVTNLGTYKFEGVDPNTTYTVVLSTTLGTVGNTVSPNLPMGWKNVAEDCCDNTGNDGNTDGKVSVMVNTTSVVNANFGIRQPVAVGNLVWIDSNRNGIRDAGELPLGGATVNLYTDFNNSGSPDGPAIATTTSDSMGNYSFGDLYSGRYIIGVTPPTLAGATYTSPVTGQEVNPNADVDNNDNGIILVGGETRSGTIILIANTEPTGETPNTTPLVPDSNSNLTVDFGFFVCPNGFVFDTVFYCVNTTADLTASEPTGYKGGTWTNGSTAVVNPTAVTAGTYTYTYGEGMCAATGTVVVSSSIPDYTPTISLTRTSIIGPDTVGVIITITELLDKPACSPLYVLVPKLTGRYSFTYDSTLTTIPIAPGLNAQISNPDWKLYPEPTNPNFYIWEYIGNGGTFPASGSIKFGYVGLYNPNNTSGETTFSVQIFQGSGGETNTVNNTDSEKLFYSTP